MRTKTTLAAAAILAAGLASSMAQANVYSLNVVGYVNVPIVAGANNLLANPLSNQTANYNTNLFDPAQVADGSTVTKWNTAANDFDGTIATYYTEISAWDLAMPLPVGEGFFFFNAGAAFTATFVGEVPASVSRTIAGGGATTAIGSSIPIGGSFVNSIGSFSPGDGDTVTTWSTANNDFDGTIATYYTEISAWDSAVPNVAPGIGLFLVHFGADTAWTRTFTVAP
jgi:predicted small integral membrane protein